jgi:hypothetical protein
VPPTVEQCPQAFLWLHWTSVLICLGNIWFWTRSGRAIQTTLPAFDSTASTSWNYSKFWWYMRILIVYSKPSHLSLHFSRFSTVSFNYWL